MRQKEIRTKKEQQNLHDELLQDLQEAVNYSKGAKVWSEEHDDDELYIKIADMDSIVHIMTGAVLESIIDVLEYYKVRYMFSIHYYMDIEDERPTFVIRVSKYIKHK